jgi:CRP-like cAMP-binding protein/DNA-binding NarL/FixJ family response regulator
MTKKIALIEDNDEVRENIAEILELANYDVVTAENGKKGVALIKKEIPDLILCDIMMPELDGYGVLYLIGKDEQTAGIPFIFLTAKSEKDDFRKGMNMGADDYLTKPFDDTQLLDAIERRLKRIEQFSSDFEANKEGLDSFLAQVDGVASLTANKRTKTFKKKEAIFNEGDYPNYMYFIISGRVKTSKMNLDGKDFVLNLFKEGDFFGFKEMIQDTDYTISAIALEDTEVAMIKRDDFLTMLYHSKEVSKKFIELLVGSITSKQVDLMNLAYDSVRKRVADALIKLYEKYAQTTEDNFSIAITRDDLASIVGTATESVIRTLSEFKVDGYIAIKGSTITILDPASLKNFNW